MGVVASLYQPQPTQQALTVELTTPVDDNRPVYIVGNFNNWCVDEQRFKLWRLAQGKFIFTFPTDIQLPKRIEYKYVRGGWENQELDDFGNGTNNRVLTVNNGYFADFVPRWSNYGLTFNPSFLPKIKVINEAFIFRS